MSGLMTTCECGHANAGTNEACDWCGRALSSTPAPVGGGWGTNAAAAPAQSSWTTNATPAASVEAPANPGTPWASVPAPPPPDTTLLPPPPDTTLLPPPPVLTAAPAPAAAGAGPMPAPASPFERNPAAPGGAPPSLPMPPAPGGRPLTPTGVFPAQVTTRTATSNPSSLRVGTVIGAIASIAIVVAALLNWYVTLNAMHVPAAVLWAGRSGSNTFKLGVLLIALGTVGLASSFLRRGALRVAVGLVVTAVVIDYFIQLERAASKVHQSFTRFVGAGCWVTLAAGIALAISPLFGGSTATSSAAPVAATSAGGVVIRPSRSRTKIFVAAACVLAIAGGAFFLTSKHNSQKHVSASKSSLPPTHPHFSLSAPVKPAIVRDTRYVGGANVTAFIAGCCVSTIEDIIEYDFPTNFPDNASHTAAFHAVRVYTDALGSRAVHVDTSRTTFDGLPAIKEARSLLGGDQTISLFVNNGSRVFVVVVGGQSPPEKRFDAIVRELKITK